MIELRELSAVDTVIGKIVAVHALLTKESDISPRNQKVCIALRELVDLLLKSYSPAETAAILNDAEVAVLRFPSSTACRRRSSLWSGSGRSTF